MDDKIILDIDSITAECINIEPDITIKNIEQLANQYSEKNLVAIYNHFLSVVKNQDVLTYVIKCVGKLRDKDSLSKLLDLLLDGENPTNLRIICAKTIANLKDTSAVSSLLYCLNNKKEDYKLRLACADALGRVGDKFAVAPLINIVQDEEEKSVYVRESAAIALGMLGDESAVDPLVSILETKKGFIDKFTFFKERIIEVLGKFNFSNDRVFKALEHSLNDESSCVRINAIEALMDSGDDRAYELIKTMLDDLDEEVQKNALIALYNMHGVNILKEVIEHKKYNEFLKNEARDMINEYEDSGEDI